MGYRVFTISVGIQDFGGGTHIQEKNKNKAGMEE